MFLSLGQSSRGMSSMDRPACNILFFNHLDSWPKIVRDVKLFILFWMGKKIFNEVAVLSI